MKYLITGGSSFIGVALTKLLITNGHEVIIVARRTSKTNGNILQSDKVKTVLYDGMQDIASIKGPVSSADVFIHLAWSGTSHEGRHDKTMQDDNIKYSLKAVRVAHELGCKLFLEAGSQAEYGFINEPFDEDTPCHPDNEYGRAKLEFGEEGSKLCNDLGMKFIHLRIVSIYGDTDHLWTLVMSSIRKMLKNEDVELSSCEQKWNFVYIKDAVKQMYLLCEHALRDQNFKSEIYLIGSKDTRVLKGYVNEMYQLTNSRSKLLFGKYTPANVVSLEPIMDKTEKATGGFISEYTFSEVVNIIINNYKNHYYEES
jgi:nucleoside-diphosphate-sugar epimerase